MRFVGYDSTVNVDKSANELIFTKSFSPKKQQIHERSEFCRVQRQLRMQPFHVCKTQIHLNQTKQKRENRNQKFVIRKIWSNIGLLYQFFTDSFQLPSYHAGNTRSCPISTVKQHWASLSRAVGDHARTRGEVAFCSFFLFVFFFLIWFLVQLFVVGGFLPS